MLVNPKEIVETGVLKKLVHGESQIQQCGIDLCIQRLYKVVGSGHIAQDKNYRRIPKYIEVLPHENKTTNELTFEIKPGQAYIFDCQETVAMPEDAMMIIKVRSTLMRMGVRLDTAIYDPGFCGSVGGGLFSISNAVTIAKAVPIGQAIWIKCEAASLYQGNYQNQESQKIEE
jgi:dUTP pyrophosphatase